MTLPVALLIACYKHESISHEIRKIVGERVSVLESLSCKCKNHISRLRLVPPCSCCSLDRSSPTSDLGSEISSSSVNSAKSYSFFSDVNDVEEMAFGDYSEQTDVDVGRCLSILMDLVENVTVRFNESYIFKEDEVKINYQQRDILDLGRNIQGHFPIKHPNQKPINAMNQSRLSVQRSCPITDCDFQHFSFGC